MNSGRDKNWPLWMMLAAASETESEGETHARMTAAYSGEGMSFEDDGSPEHDD